MNKTIIKDNKIEILDNRFYKFDNDTYVPSVTTVLSAFPKDYYFYDWLKSNGYNSDILRDRAAEVGTNVHNALEELLNGTEVNHENYTIEEWQLINKGFDFFTRHKFTNIQTETNYISKKLGYGGTVDLIADYNGEKWLIDFKTSNSIHDTHYMQLVAYKNLVEETGVKIDKIWVLHLKASTKTEKEFQGKGYRLIEVKEIDYFNELFSHTFSIFKHAFKTLKPIIKNYKTTLKF